jgi:hypothetical protein
MYSTITKVVFKFFIIDTKEKTEKHSKHDKFYSVKCYKIC